MVTTHIKCSFNNLYGFWHGNPILKPKPYFFIYYIFGQHKSRYLSIFLLSFYHLTMFFIKGNLTLNQVHTHLSLINMSLIFTMHITFSIQYSIKVFCMGIPFKSQEKINFNYFVKTNSFILLLNHFSLDIWAHFNFFFVI